MIGRKSYFWVSRQFFLKFPDYRPTSPALATLCWASAGKSLKRAGFRARMNRDLTNAQLYYQQAAEAFDKADESVSAGACWQQAALLAECLADKMYDESN
jgi:hypothetical protein